MSARTLRRDAGNLALALAAIAGVFSARAAAYAQAAPREFLGRMGENAFASSEQGLQPNEQVRLNGQDDLSKVIRGHHDACVYGVALAAAPGDPDKYVLTVDGQGPQAEKTGNLYLEFVDAAGKTLVRYDLVLTAAKRATYTVPVRAEGGKPAIKVIKWSNTPIDK